MKFFGFFLVIFVYLNGLLVLYHESYVYIYRWYKFYNFNRMSSFCEEFLFVRELQYIAYMWLFSNFLTNFVRL